MGHIKCVRLYWMGFIYFPSNILVNKMSPEIKQIIEEVFEDFRDLLNDEGMYLDRKLKELGINNSYQRQGYVMSKDTIMKLKQRLAALKVSIYTDLNEKAKKKN